MKNRFYSTLQLINLGYLWAFILALSFTIAASVNAQQTLCQQIGGNFVPDFTIGTDDTSSTTISSLGIAGWTSKKVVVNGTLVIDANFNITSCSLKMGKNATIRINPNVSFQSLFSKYFRCGSDFWTGFVAMGGTSGIWFNHIEDASMAMDIKSTNAGVVLAGNFINRNNIGMNAAGIAVNAIVAANTIDCTSPLNSASLISFAGVHLTNCPSATIGRTDLVPAFRNIFKRQSFGIQLNFSTATVGLSTFNKNMRGVNAVLSNVTIQGADFGLTTNFSLNREDVYAISSSLNVFFCLMDSCEINNINSLMNNNQERVHIHNNTIYVTNHPNPQNHKIGIRLDRSKFGNDAEIRNNIESNHIVIQDFGENRRQAMRVIGVNPTHDIMLISNNDIDVMNGGNPTVPTKFVEINVNGADNFWVHSNHIKNNNTFATGNNRWGFFLANGAIIPAKGNLLTANVIYAEGAADDGCCAVHAQDAGPWKICSNITDQTYRGFHIVGHCGKSGFGLNTIKNHNVDPLNLFVGGTGLFIQGNGADNGFLGDQNCQENTWTVTDYGLQNAYTAILLGEDTDPPLPSTIQMNEFRVKNLADPTQAPTDRNPMNNWFKPDPCISTPDSTDCLDQHLSPDFDEHDDWVRDNYPYPQAAPGVEEWQSTRYVLAKLMRYPSLATGDARAFKNAYSQSSAALFARFDSLMNAISLVTAGSRTGLNALEDSIQNKQTQINVLDATITDYSTIPTGFMSSRAVLLGELTIFSDQRNALLAQNISMRDPLPDACEQFNNALPSNQVYEQNQKMLNTLAIQQMQGIELTQADKDAVHYIA
ncbi:MAG: hypothetical protein ACKVT2_02180, partial [Saprospiraceae bacterium]